MRPGRFSIAQSFCTILRLIPQDDRRTGTSADLLKSSARRRIEILPLAQRFEASTRRQLGTADQSTKYPWSSAACLMGSGLVGLGFITKRKLSRDHTQRMVVEFPKRRERE
jgi:hypothetical protein